MAIDLQEVVRRLPVERHIGSLDKKIERFVRLSDKQTDQGTILWISDKNLQDLKAVQKGTVICSELADSRLFISDVTYLMVKNPRLYFLNFVKEYFLEKEEPFISEKAVIHQSVKLGKDVTIHPGVVIEKDCSIGDHTVIGANTVIKRRTNIGSRVFIGSNNTIGGVGFGYEKNVDGEYELIPHTGNVVIEDDVEIGNNTTIDRAVIGSTLLKRNSKIDNLVHIAHGVTIGENSLIIANSMVAGSTVIGANVWVAPSASILNGISVGDNATIGMGAVVLKSVNGSQTIVGNPGRDLAQLKKN